MSVATASRLDFEVVFRGHDLWQLAQEVCEDRLAESPSTIYLRSEWKQISQRAKRDLFIVMWESLLCDEAEMIHARQARTAGEKRFLLLPDDLPREALVEYLVKLNVKSSARIHSPRFEADNAETFVGRFLSALASWPTEQNIADAWWENGELVILSPTFERLKVPADLIPKMSKAKPAEREKFDIDQHGEFIYWPSHDVHMGWPQFEQAVNPQARIKARQHSQQFNIKYGQAIRNLREKAGLRQSQIKGVDERTVRRIEHGQTRATANALAKLASAHEMNINNYLGALADELVTM